jgi:hypothetical protein
MMDTVYAWKIGYNVRRNKKITSKRLAARLAMAFHVFGIAA